MNWATLYLYDSLKVIALWESCVYEAGHTGHAVCLRFIKNKPSLLWIGPHSHVLCYWFSQKHQLIRTIHFRNRTARCMFDLLKLAHKSHFCHWTTFLHVDSIADLCCYFGVHSDFNASHWIQAVNSNSLLISMWFIWHQWFSNAMIH